ncbi:tryptophan synthase subunit alpha [candidate division KSB1 bacterium]
MNRITELFKNAKQNNKKVFIPFITAGFPKLESTVEIISALEKGGADLIEIGIPFSDPIADGPVIQSSSVTALKNGVTLKWIFKTVQQIRKNVKIPLIFFTYLNPVMKYGVEKFFKNANKIGIDGILIPDLPPEESDEVKKFAKKNNINTIFLVTPTTSNKRMRLIEKISDDFVYCVSVTGITGTREKLFLKTKPYLMKVKSVLKKPFVVGFGVSTAEDVKKISGFSDGVVVGSAVVKFTEKYKNNNDLAKRVEKYIRELKKPIK